MPRTTRRILCDLLTLVEPFNLCFDCLAKFASIASNKADSHCISSLTVRLATRLAIRFPKLGTLLIQRSRGQDVAWRFSGEEFALILAGASREAARKRADIFCEEVKKLTVLHRGRRSVELVFLSVFLRIRGTAGPRRNLCAKLMKNFTAPKLKDEIAKLWRRAHKMHPQELIRVAPCQVFRGSFGDTMQ